MDPYRMMARRLLTALGSTTLLAAGCGGAVADKDTAPDTLETGDGTGGVASTGGASNATGGMTVAVGTGGTVMMATGGMTGTPMPTTTHPPVKPPPPPPPANVCEEYGTPERQCYDRAQLENMVRYGYGQIPQEPKSDAEVAAAFNMEGCAFKELVADSCCNVAVTDPVRDEGGNCCYVHCTGACCGRPLLIDGIARIADAINRADWLGESASGPAHVPEHLRELVAKAWLDDALLEHASVGSFSRFALELLSWGAPPELLAESHRAALDEIEHARLCFSVVEYVSGEAIGPGALELGDLTLSGDLADVAVTAVREGCVGETLAALVAREQLVRTRDPMIRATLERIAEDESRHAELAWRFVAWACAAGDDRVRRAVRAAFDEELRLSRFDRAVRAWSPADLVAWHAMGRLSDSELTEVEDRAKHDVVRVLAAELLGSPTLRPVDDPPPAGFPSRMPPGLA